MNNIAPSAEHSLANSLAHLRSERGDGRSHRLFTTGGGATIRDRWPLWHARWEEPDGRIAPRRGNRAAAGRPLPLDAVFRDEAGREVRLGSYFGDKPVVLALV